MALEPIWLNRREKLDVSRSSPILPPSAAASRNRHAFATIFSPNDPPPNAVSAMRPRTLLAMLLVVALAAATTLHRLGAADVCGSNEAVEGVFLQQMVEHGALLFPLENGRSPMYKPPLFHWTAAGDRSPGAASRKVTAFNLRLPPRSIAIAGVILTIVFRLQLPRRRGHSRRAHPHRVLSVHRKRAHWPRRHDALLLRNARSVRLHVVVRSSRSGQTRLPSTLDSYETRGPVALPISSPSPSALPSSPKVPSARCSPASRCWYLSHLWNDAWPTCGTRPRRAVLLALAIASSWYLACSSAVATASSIASSAARISAASSARSARWRRGTTSSRSC